MHVLVKPTGRMAAYEEQLLKQLETHPNATLTGHFRILEEATGLTIWFETVDRDFTRHGVT
ncbi:hypothetical protein DEFR109230_18805 [Deinococcus frigens]